MNKLTKWEINDAGQLIRKPYSNSDRPATLVHVEQKTAICNYIFGNYIDPFYNGVEYGIFENYQECLQFLKDERERNNTTELIMANILGSVSSCANFVREIRKLEKEMNAATPTPIVLISSNIPYEPMNSFFPVTHDNKYFYYFDKSLIISDDGILWGEFTNLLEEILAN